MSGAAPPPVTPTQDSIVLSQFTGLRNTVTAERLVPGELETAQNVDIDDAGQVRRRRGYTLVSTGNFHSLYRSARGLFGVKNGTLSLINPDYTTSSLQTGIGPTPLAYVEIGSEIYFSSATDSGVIQADNTVEAWGESPDIWLSPVVNPTSNLSQIRGRLLGRPPMATSLAYLNGRIYLAHDKTLWATELYLYKLTDKTRNFLQFEHEITGLGAVTDGLYVGTKTGVWFLSGAFRETNRILVGAHGMLPGSLQVVPPDLIVGQANDSKAGVVYLAEDGLTAGLDSGVTLNLTQNKVIFPDAVSVASLFRRQDGMNQYIGVADSGGTPASSTRIGDFVDAEIRRFGG